MTSLANIANPQTYGLTGRRVRPAYNLAVISQIPAARQDAALSIQKKQFDKAQSLQEDIAATQQDQARTASMISGGTSLATIGAMTRDSWMPMVKDAMGGLKVVPEPFSLDTPVPSLSQISGGSVGTGTLTAQGGNVLSPATTSLSDIATGNVATGTLDTAAPTLSQISGGNVATGTVTASGASTAGTAASTTGAVPSAVTPITSYVAPFAAGVAVPALADVVHKDSMENLGHNLSFGLAKDEKTAKTVGSTLAGAGAGAAAGAALLSETGPGALIGAAIGAVGGFVKSLFGGGKGGCIIVTACTSPDSPEVEIAREYRDNFLTPEELRGYYMLAEKIVPQMEADDTFRAMIKETLVDPLIEYGRYALGRQETVSSRAEKTALAFVSHCGNLGATVESYTRSNGEVY